MEQLTAQTSMGMGKAYQHTTKLPAPLNRSSGSMGRIWLMDHMLPNPDLHHGDSVLELA